MESEKIYEIVYASVARKPISSVNLRSIHIKAIKINTELSISGLLIYLEGSRRFVQILEGPVSAVKRIMAKIERDPRHDRIHILWQGEKPHRSFPDWAMAIALGEQSKEKSAWGKLDLPAPLAALDMVVHRGRGFDSIKSFCEERKREDLNEK